MNTPTTPVNMNQSYIRTPEDEEKDRREAEWKQRLVQEQMAAFLRRNPSGRLIPKMN